MSERTTSVSNEESLSGGSVGFEELVQWKGLVGASGELGPCVLYTMEGKEFFFPVIDEDVVSSRMAYRRPKDEMRQIGKNQISKIAKKRMNLKCRNIKELFQNCDVWM